MMTRTITGYTVSTVVFSSQLLTHTAHTGNTIVSAGHLTVLLPSAVESVRHSADAEFDNNMPSGIATLTSVRRRCCLRTNNFRSDLRRSCRLRRPALCCRLSARRRYPAVVFRLATFPGHRYRPQSSSRRSSQQLPPQRPPVCRYQDHFRRVPGPPSTDHRRRFIRRRRRRHQP